jgi:hypothetical protein
MACAAESVSAVLSAKPVGVFVGAIDGFSIPLPPAIAGSNIHHDGQPLVNV